MVVHIRAVVCADADHFLETLYHVYAVTAALLLVAKQDLKCYDKFRVGTSLLRPALCFTHFT